LRAGLQLELGRSDSRKIVKKSVGMDLARDGLLCGGPLPLGDPPSARVGGCGKIAGMTKGEKNQLYFGDCLNILRDSIEEETVDLVYLDPPFNSNTTYNILFKSPKGDSSHAQIAAFEDTWHWGQEAEKEFAQLLQQPNTDVAEMIQALRKFL